MQPNLHLNYSYEFQHDRYNYYLNTPLPIKPDLKITHVRNVYAIPPKDDDSNWRNASIVDNKGDPVPEAYLYSWSMISGRETWPFERSQCKYMKGDYIYLGPFLNHWGHFIIECTVRLYHAMKHNDIPCFFLANNAHIKRIYPQILRFFELAGITRDNLLFITEPVLMESVYIPEQSYRLGKYYSQEYLDIFTNVSNHIVPTISKLCKKVYFTRTHFNKYCKKEIGNELIDKVFDKCGFTSIAPELHSLDDQIYYINHAEEISLFAGTCVHNLAFLKNKNCNINIINKYPYIGAYIYESLKMFSDNITFLDAYYLKYPSSLAWGPYLFDINKNINRFLHDRNINYTDTFENFMITRTNLDEMETLHKHYMKCGYAVYTNPDPFHPYHFPPQMTLEWANKFLALEDEAAQKETLKLLSKALPKLYPDQPDHKVYDVFCAQPGLCYEGHFSIVGWTGEVAQPLTIGFPEKKNWLEAIKIRFRNYRDDIFYKVAWQDGSWSSQAKNGEICGTTGQYRPLCGICISLGSLAAIFVLQYRIFTQQWSEWADDNTQLLTAAPIKSVQLRLRLRSIK